jgi:3',5'-cyclic AMP phosphodiesterase CpdA
MRLLAISDLHVSHPINRNGVASMGEYPDDWLIVAGDVGEQVKHLHFTLGHLTRRFAKVIWIPGNHDLWCPADATDRTSGQARYDELVDICHSYGVLTPEDEFAVWPPSHLRSSGASAGKPSTSASSAIFICPLFLLYDYSFRPPEITHENAVLWARQSGVVCGDELLLDPAPWPSREAWCHARCDAAERRLSELPPDAETVLINHWPLRYDLARPPRVPRFSIWCGTTRTEDWPTRFRARAVVSGHLHLRTTLVRDGVRHEEVSLGYPRDWQHSRGVDSYLRDVLPDDGADAPRFVPARDPFMMRQQ